MEEVREIIWKLSSDLCILVRGRTSTKSAPTHVLFFGLYLGHFLPTDQPLRSLVLLSRFITNSSFYKSSHADEMRSLCEHSLESCGMEQGRGKCLDGGKCECSEGWIGATCESPVVEVSYPETDEGRSGETNKNDFEEAAAAEVEEENEEGDGEEEGSDVIHVSTGPTMIPYVSQHVQVTVTETSSLLFKQLTHPSQCDIIILVRENSIPIESDRSFSHYLTLTSSRNGVVEKVYGGLSLIN